MTPPHTIAARPVLHRTPSPQSALWPLLLAAMLLVGCVRGPAGPIDPPITSTAPPPQETTPPPANDTASATSQASAEAPTDTAPQSSPTHSPGKTGLASYYGHRFAGQRTASGERFDPGELTAAHPSLPFGTRVRVTNLDNGEQVTVRVNDRGPFVGSRIIDLSRQAAERIGMIHDGVAQVRIQVLQ